jgi:hypothetical protein
MKCVTCTETCKTYSVTNILLYTSYKFNKAVPSDDGTREEGKAIYICSCLTRELVKFIDYRIMLKLRCKTTFNSVGKKIIKIKLESTRDVQKVFGH